MSEHESIEDLAAVYRELIKKPKMLDSEVTKKINDEIESRSRLGNDGFAKKEELKDWQKNIMGLT